MAALIKWVCRADHGVDTGDQRLATVTIHRGEWAYCAQGLLENCTWEAIQPAPVEELRTARRATGRKTTRVSVDAA